MARPRIVYGTNPFKRYFIDDVEVTEEEFDAQFPTKLKDLLKSAQTLPSHLPGCWPMVSEALAVHPKQVAEANERAKRHGIAVHYDKKGFCHIPDRNERKKLLKLEGMHDNQGGYSD